MALRSQSPFLLLWISFEMTGCLAKDDTATETTVAQAVSDRKSFLLSWVYRMVYRRKHQQETSARCTCQPES